MLYGDYEKRKFHSITKDDNYQTVTVSGDSISVSGTKRGKFESFKILGNYSRTGTPSVDNPIYPEFFTGGTIAINGNNIVIPANITLDNGTSVDMILRALPKYNDPTDIMYDYIEVAEGSVKIYRSLTKSLPSASTNFTVNANKISTLKACSVYANRGYTPMSGDHTMCSHMETGDWGDAFYARAKSFLANFSSQTVFRLDADAMGFTITTTNAEIVAGFKDFLTEESNNGTPVTLYGASRVVTVTDITDSDFGRLLLSMSKTSYPTTTVNTVTATEAAPKFEVTLKQKV